MGRSLFWSSNSVAGEHWMVEPRRFGDDEPLEYFAGRLSRLGFENVGFDSFDTRQRAQAACELDAQRRNRRS